MLLLSFARSALAQGYDVPADYPTLAAAVLEAPEDATIRLDPTSGPYTESVFIDKSLTIEGLGGRPVLRPALAESGVLELDNASATLTLRGVEIDGLGWRALLQTRGQLVLEDVLVHDTYAPTDGGAIRVVNNAGNTLTIRDSRFETSSSAGKGAFLALLGGNLTIEDSTFTGGGGSLDGGMIATAGMGDVAIARSTLQGAAASGRGGILHAIHEGTLTIVGTEFLQGTSLTNRGGGAIYIEGPSLVEITDSTFWDNQAVGNEGGGAIYHRKNALVLRRNVFCANLAAGQGGALRLHGGAAEITNNVFLLNQGGSEGGAIYTAIMNAVFAHNSASGNTAPQGAVIFGREPIDIVDSYFADSLGGGSAIWATKDQEMVVSYSLFWNNVADDLNANVAYDAPSTLFVDAGLPPATDCDPAQLSPPPASALIEAASDGSDIGAFSGPWTWPDADDDTVLSILDCDDTDPGVGAPAPEIAGDSLDSDCDGTELCFVDGDGDGRGEPGTSVVSPDLDCGGEGEAPSDDDRCPYFDDALDADGDGVPDGCDPCPLDALDDSDGDGICDALDVCPEGNDALDADGDGIPDGCDDCGTTDSDGDGLDDDCDPCPGSADPADCERGAPTEPVLSSVGCSCASTTGAGGPWTAPWAGLALLLAVRLRRSGT